MNAYSQPIDSALSSDLDGSTTRLPITHYPPHCQQRLRQLLINLMNLAQGDPASLLPSLTEPVLYAFASAVVLLESDDDQYRTHELCSALVAELRWRNCRTMGSDPAGAVRRGRLIQMVSAFVALSAPAASSLSRRKLYGACPFCDSAQFHILLKAVRWQCFGCERSGGLLEFAEQLLQTRIRQA